MSLGNKKIDVEKIIKSSDDELKKEIVENGDKYNTIDIYDVCDILCSIDDDEYKINIIEKAPYYGFRPRHVSEIAASIKNEEYKDNIIRNKGKYALSASDILVIANSMNILSINRILCNRGNYLLKSNDLANIVKGVSNDDFKKGIIANSSFYDFDSKDIANILATIKDDNYKKEYISKTKKDDIDSFSMGIVILSIKDDDYKYNIINNYKEYNLLVDDVIHIIGSFSDDKYIYEIIKNYKKYDFDLDCLSDIVCLVRNNSYKIDVIGLNTFGFNSIQLTNIVNSISNSDIKSKLMDILYERGDFKHIVAERELVLPQDMTFGIEIECEGNNSSIVRRDLFSNGWNTTKDYSLHDNGVEVVSPILKAGDEKEINKVCSILSSLDLEITKRCAGHVHIGAQYFGRDVNCYKNLIEIFSNMENILYVITNQEGDIPRDSILKFSYPITVKILEALKEDANYFKDIDKFERFMRDIKRVQKTRSSSLNFNNLGTVRKNTIEFRMPNGSLNSSVWIDNVNLFGSIMWLSIEISNIQMKPINSITEEDKLTLYYYEELKNQNISDRDKLKVLLNMLPMLNKKVYMNRYDVNSELYSEFDNAVLINKVSRIKPIWVSECSEELKKLINSSYQSIDKCFNGDKNKKNVI